MEPTDLKYLGAFRLPETTPGAPDAESWEHGGRALAYRPHGDPGGNADGYRGSLLGTGHDVHNYVSKIAIPPPIKSRDLEELNVAVTLQGFHDLRRGNLSPRRELDLHGTGYHRRGQVNLVAGVSPGVTGCFSALVGGEASDRSISDLLA